MLFLNELCNTVMVKGEYYFMIEAPFTRQQFRSAYSIYPVKFKFVLVKISLDSERLHGRHAKEDQTLVTFFYEIFRTLLFTRVCKYVLILVKLCCEFNRVNAFTL